MKEPLSVKLAGFLFACFLGIMISAVFPDISVKGIALFLIPVIALIGLYRRARWVRLYCALTLMIFGIYTIVASLFTEPEFQKAFWREYGFSWENSALVGLGITFVISTLLFVTGMILIFSTRAKQYFGRRVAEQVTAPDTSSGSR